MRHVIKYLLVLALLMSGFYMARVFRVSQPTDAGGGSYVEGDITDLPTPGEDSGGHAVSDRLPVAALADVDRTPVAVVDEVAKFDPRQSMQRIEAETGRPSLGGRPTVRRSEGPQREHPPADEDVRASQGTRRGAAYDNAVPDFATDYEPWLDPLEESAYSDTDPVQWHERSDSRNETRPGNEQEQDRRVRRHRIVEGDTLQRLAESFLGDRERYLELYEANDDVLFHPQLLPIGIEIVIPVLADTLMADEDEDSNDTTAQVDPFRDVEDAQSRAEPAYSSWGEY